jgi:hypothetical protein
MRCPVHHAHDHVSAPLPPIAYENEPGAASRPLPPGYRRREPEKTVLYKIVQANLETMLEEARLRSASGSGYPKFIEDEFRRYLGCGQFSRGLGRIRCPVCGYEQIVAASCKSRICPSCLARRAADIAAHLVDRVLPEARYRQFVVTFPWQIHFLLSVDRQFMSRMLGAYLRTLFAWQRLRGRQSGIANGQTGAITFIQRFSSTLGLFPHLHSLVPDGLFVSGDGPGDGSVDQHLEFVALPPPTDDEIAHLTNKVANRLTAIAMARLEKAHEQPEWADDDQAALHAGTAEALRPPLPLQPELSDVSSVSDDKPLCSRSGGFSLHAARVVEPRDRPGLEKLCRYGLRAPFALDRFSLDPDGRVRYHLPKPWPGPGGKTELVFEPVALLRRLAALIPAPYGNLVRYHGIFANRSRYRPLLPRPPVPYQPTDHTPPTGPDTLGPEPTAPDLDAAPQTADTPIRPRRLKWQQLIKRVFGLDPLRCPRCSATMVVVAFITDPPILSRILNHLGLPTTTPPLAPANLSLQQELDFADQLPPDDAYLDLPHDDHDLSAPNRGPP